MSSDHATAFLEAIAVLESDGDPEPLVELFADEAECGNSVSDRTFTGRDGAREFWTQDRALFDEVTSTYPMVVDAGDQLVLNWVRRGTSALGEEVSYEGVSLVEYEDGEIVRFRAFYNPAVLGAQLA